MKQTMFLVVLLISLIFTGGKVNAETVLYENNFDSGSGSISVEGWTHADKIVYDNGFAYRNAPGTGYGPGGDTENLLSELAFSHALSAGEVVTLTADLVGAGNADVAIGLRTTNKLYRAITRVPSDVCLSTTNYDLVGLFNLGSLNNLTISYRIVMTQDSVSFEMKPSWGNWESLGSIAVTETAITHIVLGSGFADGTNSWGSDFRWDNIRVTSVATLNVLYENNFNSGTEWDSISGEGWTNADEIYYLSGTAKRNVLAGNTQGLTSELAFSHILIPGETVTLQADLLGAGSGDVAIGFRTENNQYKAISRLASNSALSIRDLWGVGDLVQVNSIPDLYNRQVTYRIHLSQDSVSWEMKEVGEEWVSLGSAAVSEKEIKAIVLGHNFPDGTNAWGSIFQWDNILITLQKAPVFSHSGKYISGPTPVTIAYADEGASIYYTTDGEPPTSDSNLYKGTSITVNDGMTLKAVAIVDGEAVSEVTSQTFEYNPARADLSRGHYLLIEKGLQLQAYIYPEAFGSFNLSNWNNSYFTTVNTTWNPYNSAYLPAAPGIPWARVLNAFAEMDITGSEVPYLSNLVSLQLGDEQTLTSETISGFATFMSRLKVKHPDVIFYSNQWGYGATVEQLQTYMQTAKPDMLMFDTYPFYGNELGGSPTVHYEHMQKYRLLGLAGNDGTGENPIPYALYTQTFTGGGWDHLVSESEIRLNEFSAWSFGFKFICAFVYGNPNAQGINTIMFGNNGNDNYPTPQFYQIAETNRQSRNLGPALVRLQSTDVRMIMGLYGTNMVNPAPPGVATYLAGADPYLTQDGFQVMNLGTKNGGLPGDVIFGFFKPLHEAFDGDGYNNEKYFMVVNGLSDPIGTAAETRQKITLSFNMGSSGITSLQRLNRDTGKVEIVPLVNDGDGMYHLDLVLDGGTGDLFKYNTGAPFVGVTQAAPIPGDANLDGKVNVGDLGILAANYGGEDKTWEQGDFNGDGKVNVGDLGILAANYGAGVDGASDFATDYAKVFGTNEEEGDSEIVDDGSLCSGLGLPLIVGLVLLGLMLVKLDE